MRSSMRSGARAQVADRLGLDHAPVAQRRVRRERVPMRLRQHRERQPKARLRRGAVARGRDGRRASRSSSSSPATSSSSSRSNGERPKTRAQWTSAGVKSAAGVASTASSAALAPRRWRALPSARARRAIAAISHCRLSSASSVRAEAGRLGRRVHAGTVICCVTIEDRRRTAAVEQHAVGAVDAQAHPVRSGRQAVGKLEHQRIGRRRRAACASPRRRRAARIARCSRRTCGRDAQVTVTAGGTPPRVTVAAGSPSAGIGGNHRRRRQDERNGVGLARIALAGRREANARRQLARRRARSARPHRWAAGWSPTRRWRRRAVRRQLDRRGEQAVHEPHRVAGAGEPHAADA